MRLFLLTSESMLDAMLADGPPNGAAHGRAVTLTDRRPPSWSINGQALILFDVPEDAIGSFELDGSDTAREFAVPAEALSRFPIRAVRRPGSGPAPARQLVAPAPRRRAWPGWRISLVALLLVLCAAGGYAFYTVASDDEGSQPQTRARERRNVRAERAPAPSRPPRTVQSVAVGTPDAGQLIRGVPFPVAGRDHFTWDQIHKRSPNPRGRRYGTDYVVRTVLRVLRNYRASVPGAPRVGISDLSHPKGGDFSARFGGHGHVTHENGLDVDVLYPRTDGRQSEAASVRGVDRRLAQALVRAFVRAQAARVFVDPRLGLKGPATIVQPMPLHDTHMHVSFPNRS